MRILNLLSCYCVYLVSRCQAESQYGENVDNTGIDQQQEESFIKSDQIMESVSPIEQLKIQEEQPTYYPIQLKLDEWEEPNFVYRPYLNFQSHSEVLRMDLRGVYTQRHLWNHVSILRQVLPFTGRFVFFEQALDSLARVFRVNYNSDILTDQSCVRTLRSLLSATVVSEELPEDTLYWNNPVEYPNLMQIYSNERHLWRDAAPDCIFDLFARNYLIMILTYLTFLNRFDNQQLVREGSAMYNLLTDYNRFVNCGTINTYENALAHADRLFRQSFTSIPI